MTLEELRRKKRELRLTSEMIAEASGVPLGTVQKLFGGTTKAPRKRTVEAVEKALYLEELRQNAGVSRAVLSAGQVGEGAVPYPSAGEGTRKHTISGYYALPEEQRAELIDGIFYDMSTPAYIHQKILGLLHLLFTECTAAHGEDCEVCISPCDVRLDQDLFTMVQPDLMVLCRPIDLHAVRLEGAPDLVLEILSPSTRAKDQLLKLYKYQKAGVREYWIVDPEYRTVTVHFFEEEAYHPVQYGFGDVIPVGISGGTCAIDFSRVLEKIRGYYE